MSLEVFILGSEAKQVTELKKFLRIHGAKALDSSECNDENWVDEFRKSIGYINYCWKCDSVSETDGNDVLHTVSLLVRGLPLENLEEIINLLCEQYLDFSGDNIRKHKPKLFSLNLLFYAVAPESRSKCMIYVTLLTCAKKLGSIHRIVTDHKKVSSWLDKCDCSITDRQQVWRKLYEIHSEVGESRRATEALIYLLSTYTEATAAAGRQDAIKCILSVLQDPSLLAHDRLYALRPVQFLEGETVHDFFKIFVSGNLSTFKLFLSKHPDFLLQNGLDEKICLQKLRLLMLMQLAENQSDISYETASGELEISIDELEPFLIEAIRLRAVACKLDQVNRRILISAVFPRNFGRAQWANLHTTLLQWRDGLASIQSCVGAMVQAKTT